MKTSITTILQTYKRPEYFQEQLDAIKNQTISSKVIVVQNKGGMSFDYPKEIDHVIYSSKNMKFHLRFAIGLLTDTEYVAFFDDDTIPQQKWFENCIQTIKKHDCICVTNGRIVDIEKNKQHCPGWGDPSNTETLVDFGGHAWLFRTENLRYMFFDDILEHNNGEDIQLSANAQIFGNIPTYVPPHPINDKTLWGSDPKKAMEYGCDSVASWIINKDHNKERFNLFDEYIKRGWKLILNK